MCITKVGPAGYRFQDKVALWGWGCFIDKYDDVNIVCEEDGIHEDITIHYQNNKNENVIEIQCKNKREFEFKDFIDCIVHFGSRQSDTCVLDNVSATRKMIIVTSARCGDGLGPYIISTLDTCLEHRDVSRSDLKKVESAICKKADDIRKSSELSVQRSEHLKKINLEDGAVKNKLKNIYIVENISEKYLIENTKEILNKKKLIPEGALDSVFSELCVLARDCAGKKESINKDVEIIIKKYSQPSEIKDCYVIRQCEDEWIKCLKEKNVLLLSGCPRCGKSYAGRYVAERMMEDGFLVKKVSDVSKALDILNGDDKVCVLLDDPFGNRGVKTDRANKDYIRFGRLFKTVNERKKCIVCQSQDELLSVSKQSDLGDCSINGVNWFDLSELEGRFLVSIWDSYKEKIDYPQDLILSVQRKIEEGEGMSPGILDYIAHNYRNIAPPYTFQKIDLLCKREAIGYAQEFSEVLPEDETSILAMVAALSFECRVVDVQDLMFILQENEEKNFPAKFKRGGRVRFELGGEKLIGEKQCEYVREYLVPDDVYDSLEKLKNRHLIELDNSAICFRNPFYQDVCEQLLSNFVYSRFKKNILQLGKSFYSASPLIAKSFAKFVKFFLRKEKDKRRRIDLAQCGMMSRDSKYVVVFDLLYPCLLENLDLIADGDKSKLLNPRFRGAYWGKKILWKYGEPVISDYDRFNLNSYDKSPSRDVCVSILERLDGVNLPSSEEVFDFLTYCKGDPLFLSEKDWCEVFEYDFCAIKMRAVDVWFKVGRLDDSAVFLKIEQSKDVYPVVAVYCAARDYWKNMDRVRREKLKCFLQGEMQKSQVTAREIFIQLCVDYNKADNFYQSNEFSYPWDLFFDVALVFFDLHLKLYSRELSQFCYCLKICRDVIARNKMEKLYKALIQWVCDCANRDQYQLDDCFCLLNEGILFLIESKDESLKVAKLVLSKKPTLILMSALDIYFREWDRLHDEKQEVIKVLDSDRKDLYWIKSVLLLQSKIPFELQDRVIPSSFCKENNPKVFIESLDPELLAHAVCLYSSVVLPVGIYFSYRNNPIWDFVFLELLKDIYNPLFQIVLSSFVKTNNTKVILNVVRDYCNDPVYFFDVLLAEFCVIRFNFEFLEIWETLFDRMEAGARLQCFQKIAKVFPLVTDRCNDVEFFTSREEDQSLILGYFPKDRVLFKLISQASSSDDIVKVIELSEKCPPVCHEIYEIIQEKAGKIGGVPSEMIEKLASLKCPKITENCSNPFNYAEWADWFADILGPDGELNIQLPRCSSYL
ncbi:hypothetical protein LWC08_02915 [Desulfobaculum bizertense]|uniref:nSTAND3 domain-containing NTPase n=1 Tax=Desulfobaculum bizertense TaxID=376490 RepID=UPI001F2542BB|nr:hypothetical protein [Desulfobaculum bizertense]UIJ38536.1 hypothetical protein LWC08_02915 [Desulfobaculum bizertense]